MSTETRICTRHEAVESSENKDLISEKSSKAHRDRGLLLAYLDNANRINKTLLAELQSEQAERKQAEDLLEHEYEKADQRRKKREAQQGPTKPNLSLVTTDRG